MIREISRVCIPGNSVNGGIKRGGSRSVRKM